MRILGTTGLVGYKENTLAWTGDTVAANTNYDGSTIDGDWTYFVAFTVTAGSSVVLMDSSSDAAKDYLLTQNASGFFATTPLASGTASNSAAPTGRHSFAVVVDEGTPTCLLYMDGILTDTISTDTTGEFEAAASLWGASAYVSAEHIKLYSRVLQPSAVWDTHGILVGGGFNFGSRPDSIYLGVI